MSESATVKGSKRSVFFWVRVSILLFILFVVSLHAIKDLRSRRARNAWDHTLDIALVVVHIDGTPAVDPDAIRVLEERLPALDERLQVEARAGIEPDQWDSRIYVSVRKPPSLVGPKTAQEIGWLRPEAR